jgi:polygalacturonase
VEVTAGFDVRWVDVRPRSAGVRAEIGPDHSTVRFRLKDRTPLTVEFNCDIKRVLHLFSYEAERDAPAPGARGVRYFGPGEHAPGLMELADGETVYLAPGAWVKGNIRAVGRKGIVIRGRGVLDGTLVAGPGAARPPAGVRPAMGSRNMIYLEQCEGARIEGITVFNSYAWTVYLNRSDGATMRGVRILSSSPNYGNDGIDIVSSSRVTVEDVFVRTNDDCVVVKNMGDVEVRDVVVRRAVFWNMPTGGNAVEIGFELRNKPVHHIRFEEIDILHVERGAAISIHNGDASDVHHITFENIRVEDVRRKVLDFAVIFAQYGLDRPATQEERSARMDRGGSWDGLQRYRPEEKAERAKFRGRIREVVVKNLEVVEGALPYSVIAGFDEEHAVENVRIENFRWAGKRLRNAEEARLATQFARGIHIE